MKAITIQTEHSVYIRIESSLFPPVTFMPCRTQNGYTIKSRKYNIDREFNDLHNAGEYLKKRVIQRLTALN